MTLHARILAMTATGALIAAPVAAYLLDSWWMLTYATACAVTSIAVGLAGGGR